MNIAIISSKGGHLGQIKIIFTSKVIGDNNAILITEKDNCNYELKKKEFLSKFDTYYFKKDSLGFNPFNYIERFFAIRKILKKNNIEMIVTNGAQLSISAVIAAKTIGIKTVFIDTVIRVKTPNWSARASYLFSDIFLVQHKNMAKKYGRKAKYVGGIL